MSGWLEVQLEMQEVMVKQLAMGMERSMGMKWVVMGICGGEERKERLCVKPLMNVGSGCGMIRLYSGR